MDIKQALEKKTELEKQIAELLLQFSEETSLTVERIESDALINLGGQIIRYKVEIDARLK